MKTSRADGDLDLEAGNAAAPCAAEARLDWNPPTLKRLGLRDAELTTPNPLGSDGFHAFGS
jgi:hypothetical protein